MTSGPAGCGAAAPPAIHEVTLETFLAASRPRLIAATHHCSLQRKAMVRGVLAEIERRALPLRAFQRPSSVAGFLVAHEEGDWRSGAVVVWDLATGAVAGGQATGLPYVKPGFRRFGLGREIIILAHECGICTHGDPLPFTPEIFAARQSAHALAVARALAAGLRVPPEVLRDYGDLVQVQARIPPHGARRAGGGPAASAPAIPDAAAQGWHHDIPGGRPACGASGRREPDGW